MTFTKIHNPLGDSTTPYEVSGYQAKTIVEFINEALEDCQNEWGRFCVKDRELGFLFCNSVEYKHGELLEEIPDEWQYREIESVEAVGGWGRIDYNITPKTYT